MKLSTLLTASFYLLIAMPVVSQSVQYDIVIAGRTVGSAKVINDASEPENIRHRIDAEVSVPFYSGNLRSENQFVDGTLKTALTDYRANGRKKDKTLTHKSTTGQYQVDFVDADGVIEKHTDVKHGITKTIVNLYYEEPVNVNEVYSEKYGRMCKIERVGEGRYAVSMPSGKQTLYSYINGKCREVSMELMGVKLKMVRKDMQLARK